MFTHMRFEGFKAWRDTGQVRMAPLTVFFGGNSSGKTSLLQALLLLKQTAESPDRARWGIEVEFICEDELGEIWRKKQKSG